MGRPAMVRASRRSSRHPVTRDLTYVVAERAKRAKSPAPSRAKGSTASRSSGRCLHAADTQNGPRARLRRLSKRVGCAWPSPHSNRRVQRGDKAPVRFVTVAKIRTVSLPPRNVGLWFRAAPTTQRTKPRMPHAKSSVSTPPLRDARIATGSIATCHVLGAGQRESPSACSSAPRGMIACLIRALRGRCFPCPVAAERASSVAKRPGRWSVFDEVFSRRAWTCRVCTCLSCRPRQRRRLLRSIVRWGPDISTAVRVNSHEAAQSLPQIAEIDAIGRSGPCMSPERFRKAARGRHPRRSAPLPMLDTAPVRTELPSNRSNLIFARRLDAEVRRAEAADGFVAWHGQDESGEGGEEARRLIARSRTRITFGGEALCRSSTACADAARCDWLPHRAGTAVLYRSATKVSERDIYRSCRATWAALPGTRTHGGNQSLSDEHVDRCRSCAPARVGNRRAGLLLGGDPCGGDIPTARTWQ